HRLFARVTTHGQCLRDPFLRNGLKPPIEGLVEPFVHQHGTEADHAVIAGYGPVGLYVDHEVAHHTCFRAEWNNRQVAGGDRNAEMLAASSALTSLRGQRARVPMSAARRRAAEILTLWRPPSMGPEMSANSALRR